MFTVILIDDERIIREGLRKMIPWKDLGCEIVAEAEDGIEGLEMIKEHVPDIIISDIRMPRQDGLDMIEKMRDLNQNSKIIILTGYREFEYAQKAIELGVMKLLLKPSKIDKIKEVVEKAVKELKTESKEKKEYKKIKTKARKYYLMNAKKDTNEEEEQEDKPQFLVNQAIRFIQENFHNKLSLKVVSEELYVSTWHLCKILKNETGTNFVDLLNEVRIMAAKEELITSNLRIYEIAANVGYSDTAYFSKIFKKFEGITPNEYRNTQYCTTKSKLDVF